MHLNAEEPLVEPLHPQSWEPLVGPILKLIYGHKCIWFMKHKGREPVDKQTYGKNEKIKKNFWEIIVSTFKNQ